MFGAIANQFNAIVTRNPQYFSVVTPRIITPTQLIAVSVAEALL